ncbi:MAG: translation initiation factor IF-3 [Flavobacteriales bacterium]|nr:translation initiation factor IF-3 [Flavobacteriales bacterium]MBT3572109.1 translation initiation factor IF-3 [Flavobacteriales bacterium]MBT3677699.1 translation initiation factor IF-3 [Flavobacteriales bacterium]MBT3739996.1 translation initiation factor IF-3 [Flavobacteriales bacterium]MBT4101804.1 translation initiation factor IF-3 [Flavobacteriales bacterium]
MRKRKSSSRGKRLGGYRQGRREKKYPNRINDEILAPSIRLIQEGKEPIVIDTRSALASAQEQDLDLVLIAEKSDPPVCKIIDYKKFLYDQKKKQKEIASKAQKVVIKEVRFGPQTDDHDYAFKLKHARKFLEDGSKLKAFVFFRGRSIIFKEQGELLLLRLAQDVADLGKVEALPHLEGKRMFLLIAPIKK